MPVKAFVSTVSLAAFLCSGCMTPPKATTEARGQVACDGTEGQTIRVKAPPQRITIEEADCPATGATEKKSGESKESRPESAKQRETSPKRPEADLENNQPESAVGALSALGQIASLTRTTAMTRPLGTVNPGSSAIGLGITWIHIPIPLPRLFTVDEQPTVTVPLSEANLMPMVGTGDRRVSGGRTISKQEISALVAQELAAQRPQTGRQESAVCAQPDDAERKRLEKKLSDAEAQIDKMSKILQTLDDKLPAVLPPIKKSN